MIAFSVARAVAVLVAVAMVELLAVAEAGLEPPANVVSAREFPATDVATPELPATAEATVELRASFDVEVGGCNFLSSPASSYSLTRTRGARGAKMSEKVRGVGVITAITCRKKRFFIKPF